MATMSKGSRARLSIRSDRWLATIIGPRAIAPVLRELFCDQLPGANDPRGVTIDVGEDLSICLAGRRWDPGRVPAFADQLLYAVMRATLDADVDRLHFHAGLVSIDGRGLLLAGLPGSGKSTLIAQLIASDFAYHTDERVAIDRGGAIGALEKPLSVVGGSFAVLEALTPSVADRGVRSDRVWHVPASAIRADSAVRVAPALAAIAFVSYQPSVSANLQSIHPLEAARLLLADSPDDVRFGPDALALTTSLCLSVPCVSVVHGGDKDALDLIRTLALTPASSPPPPTLVEIVPGPRPATGVAPRLGRDSILAPAAGVFGVSVGDRSLVRTARGTLVGLDETRSAWLGLLDGRSTLGSLVDEVAVEAGMNVQDLLPSALAVLTDLAECGVVA